MSETKEERKIGDIDPISFACAVAQAAAVRFQLAKLDDDTAMENPVTRLQLNGWMTFTTRDAEKLEADGARVAETLDSMANYVCDRIERGASISGEILFNKCVELDLLLPGENIKFAWDACPIKIRSLFNLYSAICSMSFLALETEQRAEARLEQLARADAGPRKVPVEQTIFERYGGALEKDPDMVLKQPAAGTDKAGQANGTPVKAMSAGETVAKRPANKGGRPRKAGKRKPAAKSTKGATAKS